MERFPYRIADYTRLLAGRRLVCVGPDGPLTRAALALLGTHGAVPAPSPEETDVLLCGFLPDAGLGERDAAERGFLEQLPVIRTALSGMRARGDGTAVGVIPASAAFASPGEAACAAAGAALEAYLRSMAMSCAGYHVRVNCVRYGWQLGTRGTALAAEPGGAALLREGQPIRRRGTPEDIARAVLFFASPMSEFLAGESLTVDGGSSAVGHENVWRAGRFELPRGEDAL